MVVEIPLLLLCLSVFVFVALLVIGFVMLRNAHHRIEESETRLHSLENGNADTLDKKQSQAPSYQSLLNLTNDAVFISDFEGIYIAVNQRAADLLGLSIDELIGKSFHEFVPPVYHVATMRIFERLSNGESVSTFERTYIKANGHRFPAEVIVQLINDMAGKPQYICSIARDMSERKKIEEQRLELILERERMTTLQQFLRDASHYFRTPLTSLKTSQYLLTQIKDNPEKEAHFLHVMKLEIARLERLLADMMLSTELEQDTGNGLTFGRVDLADILPEIVNTYSPSEKREAYADIVIEPDLPSKTLYVMASRAKFSEAIRRILDNAITYSPPDSTVIVHAYKQEQMVYIDINDSGIGISEEEIPLLFQRFQRTDRAIEMAHVGNGLGLFIANKIVEIHYGEITVNSTVDKGSTFTIRLPMVIQPSTRTKAQSKATDTP